MPPGVHIGLAYGAMVSVIMERVVTLLRHADTKQGGSLASTNGYRQANIIDVLIGENT